MICVEIPLRTLRDQIDALEQASEPGDGNAFAAGACAALAWMLDPKNNNAPVVTLVREWCQKGTIQ